MDSTEWLRLELTKRREKNPSFSLRSFARILSVQPGRLSEILARKRPLTSRQLGKFAEKLAVHPKEVARLTVASASSKITGKASKPSFAQLERKHFEIVSDPVHFHILSAMELSGCDGSPRWLAQVLAKDVGIVRSSLERLKSIGLVHASVGDRWTLSKESQSTSANFGVSNAALRRAHRASMEHATQCLDDVPMELRDISSITIAIDLKKLGTARAMIQKFRRQLASELESGDRTEVYELNVQLVPVTKVRS